MKKAIILIVFSSAALCGTDESYRAYFNALINEKEGKYEKALEEYAKAAQLDPDPYIYKSAVRAAMAYGDIPKALEYSRISVENDSSSAQAWYEYGNALWAANKNEEAQKAFLNAIKIDENYAEAYYQIASLNNADPVKAMYYLNKLIELRPDLKADAYMRAAEIYYNAKNVAKALEYLKKSAQADEFYSRPRYMLALYYEDIKDWNSAISMYKQIAAAEPENPDAFIKIGELYLSGLEDSQSAEKYFLAAYRVSPKNPQVLYWLSVLSEMKKDFGQAMFYARELDKYAPSASNSIKIGYYQSFTGDINGAIDTLLKAHKKWPENYELPYFISLGYDDLKDNKKARFYLEKALSLKPDYSQALMQLGVVCERLNDTKCFKKSFENLIKKEPDNHTALNYLGYSLADRGLELDLAESLVKKALEYEPENAAYLDSMAWVLYKKKKNDEAAAYIEKSIARYGEDPVVLLHAGDIYSSLGEYEQAWKNYALSALMTPDKKTASRAAESFKKISDKKIFLSFLSEKYAYSLAHETPCYAKFNLLGRSFSADCHISLKENGKFYFIVYDPFMSPYFYFSFEKEDFNIKLPDEIKENPAAAEKISQAARMLRFVFSPEIANAEGWKYAGGRFEKNGYKSYLNREKNFFEKINSGRIKVFIEKTYLNGKIKINKLMLKMPGVNAEFYFREPK